jgi:hypothetical protein
MCHLWCCSNWLSFCCAAGSLFLFDRNQLKSFRRDSHVWKSKAGGKTVQETHEKLKVRLGRSICACI